MCPPLKRFCHIVPPPLRYIWGVVTFFDCFVVSNCWSSFKVKYKVETVLVQVINLSIRCPPRQDRHVQGLTTVTEMPRDDWNILCRMAILLPCTLVGLVTFEYKYGLSSDLRAPNFKFWGPPASSTAQLSRECSIPISWPVYTEPGQLPLWQLLHI